MKDLRAIGRWAGCEARLLLGWLREPGLWLALALGAVLWSLAYQAPPSPTLHIGGDLATHLRRYDEPFLAGFNASEPEVAGGEWWQQPEPPYRWSMERAEVLLPGLGGGLWEIRVLARSGRPDGSAAPSRWAIGDAAAIPLEVGAAPRVYRLLGVAGGGDLRLALDTPPLDAPGDRRTLGLVVHRVTAAPAGGGARVPPLRDLGLLAATTGLAYGLAWRARAEGRTEWTGRMGWTQQAASLLVVGGLAFFLVRDRLGLTAFLPGLALLLGACYVLTGLLAPLLGAAARALGVACEAGERGLALAAVVGGFGLRMAGVLHPYAIFSDLRFNANNLAELTWGALFQEAGLPCEAGAGMAPYPPAAYLWLAPAQALLDGGARQRELLVLGGVALLESCGAAVLWLLLRRAGMGRRAALLSAALYVAAAPLLRSYSIGEMANLFAQALLPPLLLGLALWPAGGPRRAGWLVGALLAALLLSHTGVSISTAALLGAWLLVRALTWRGAAGATYLFLGAGAAAGLVAALLFYSAFAHLPAQNAAARAALAARTPPLICPPGYPLGDKLGRTLALGAGPGGSLAAPLLAAGAAGALLMAWRGGANGTQGAARCAPAVRDRAGVGRVVMACWLGTLLSFGTLLWSDQAVRWAAFLFPALCLSSGAALAAWGRRGAAGAVLAAASIAYIVWFGVELWWRQIAEYLH